MLRHAEELFNPVPTKIIYCYGIYQKEFEQMLQSMPNLTLVEGFPDNLCEMTCGHDNSLVVLDDLMSQSSNDPRVSDLFTHDSHHLGMSVLYLTQNLFPPGERSRTISLNSQVLIVFRNPHDSLGVSTLARQMFPKHTGYLLEAFHDATSRPYGYLVIDSHQLTPENMRLRTNILPEERGCLCETCLKAERVLKTDHFQDVKAHERKSAVSSSHGEMRT